MKIKLLSWILLLSLLFCSCGGESLAPPPQDTKPTETASAPAQPKEEKKTEKAEVATEVDQIPLALRLTEEEKTARNARLAEALRGKKISFIGDSISTFEGFSNNVNYNPTIGENAVYYNGTRKGFADVNETWWMQTVHATGMELCVNNSWSGDRVTKRGIERAKQLHNAAGAKPDVIVVYLGINDFRNAVTEAQFKTAYDQMIGGMKETYPEADVYLCTLVYTSNVSDYSVRPQNVVKFNAVISELAEKYGASVVDLYNGTGITWKNMQEHMADGSLHPSYLGMDKITECVLSALAENYLK
ncbi:MAG: SGNH/GDSL hydrolase family protein [Ruminococcaceae bacterium]|nr:SGNH/GDSL hydrolase family protein [Oscillospiraceae bacterium]